MGVILLLSSASISGQYFTAQANQAVAPSPIQDAVTLPAQPTQLTPLTQPPQSTDLSTPAVNQPIGEEANEDFHLESLPTWEPEPEATFDIPIVVNRKQVCWKKC